MVAVILDCDPGHDDALAILLAAADPSLDLLAITTVAGNQTLDKCTLNARRVCTVAGITGVPIAAGADRPLRRPRRVAAHIHGESGLDGPAFGEPTVGVSDEPAVELMRGLLLDRPEPVTLVPTGPLTNIATLLDRYPEVREGIAEIVLMGGSTGRGNTSPYAEFNIAVDPEAAEIVFGSGLDVTMVGLNATHQALVTPDVVARIRAVGTDVADVCADLMTFYAAAYERVYGLPGPPLHDPMAVARVIDRSVVGCVPAPVRVETAGTYTSGATAVDLHHVTGEPDNALVAVDVDVRRYFDLVVEAVTRVGLTQR
ncbi:MAG: nucleoside hydrolase [Streptosporangiales bacterium]|nr:nucleoside hydrolase [Streptosporangiales bacterium]MBO0889810.1 nucleoside hydrolase [Acidothermales bacterium]